MSEGPEVRRTADRLAEALQGRTIEAVEFRRRVGLPEGIASRIVGARVKGVRTVGKHLMIDFTRRIFLHNHMMMFGKWRTYTRTAFDAGTAKSPPHMGRVRTGPAPGDVRLDRRVRLVLVTADVVAVEFNGPVLDFSTTDPTQRAAIQRLGPDALTRPFDVAEARRRLRDRRGRVLADVLLDQTFVAGVGNKYKSEILWMLHLDPFMRVDQLTARETTALLRKIPVVLQEGYRAAGRTRPLAPGESAAAWSLRHWAFRRHGRPCFVCGDRIEMDRRRTARVTFHCPTCQPARAREHPFAEVTESMTEGR